MGNQFTAKSEANWKEGNVFLDKGLADVAANRLYYAVFQAIKGFGMAKKGWDVHDSNNVHMEALNLVCGPQRGKGDGFRGKLNQLRALRIKADYYPEPVDIEELRALLDSADTIRKHHIAKAD